MTSAHRLAPLLCLCLFTGCSQSALDNPSSRLDPGPHRGAIRAIDDKLGFVEVVTEPVRDAPSGSPKFRVAVYFLGRDQTSTLKPVPTDVVLKASWADAPAPRTIEMTAEPASGDPTGAAKFVSPPVEHKGAPTGSVSAKIGDRAVSASL